MCVCQFFKVVAKLQCCFRGSAKSMLEQDDSKLQQELLQKLADHKLTGPTLQLSFYCDPKCLPPKLLPHGNLSCLFALYCAYSNAVEGQEPAGRSVFYAVAQKWRACLRFHKQSNHSACTTCLSLKSKLAAAKEAWYRSMYASLIVVQKWLINPKRSGLY